jgi:hypothetical protein
MLPSTSTDKVHPKKMHDESKHLTEHNETTNKTHGKTEAHGHTNTRRKSDATEHTTLRRKSDAERHAYADAHIKEPHPGINSSFNWKFCLSNLSLYVVRISFLFT